LSLGVLTVVETVKVELAFPPGFSLTVAGFRVSAGIVPLNEGAIVADILTVPANSFTLTRVSAVETMDPG
jgi:hypothetical protein